MMKDSFVEVDGLCIALRPLARDAEDGASMFESMWSSISSSMQLAQDCLDKEELPIYAVQSSPMDGLERFAQIIDNILNRVTARLTNSTIRLEYMIPDTDRGIAIIIKIQTLQYKNEANETLSDPSSTSSASSSTGQHDVDYEPPEAFSIASYATHHIEIEGVSFYTEEFRIADADGGQVLVSCILISLYILLSYTFI